MYGAMAEALEKSQLVDSAVQAVNEYLPADMQVEVVKRKRGRPKGSKNRSKRNEEHRNRS